MIEDRLIDDKITLRELLALAVCRGVMAGRGDIDYSRGPWSVADDILDETVDVLDHKSRVLGLRSYVQKVANE